MFKRRKNKEDNILEKIALIIACSLDEGISEEDIDYAITLGKKVYFDEQNKRKKPKITSIIKIDAKDKETAIKQVQQLELDKKLEKTIISIIKNNY